MPQIARDHRVAASDVRLELVSALQREVATRALARCTPVSAVEIEVYGHSDSVVRFEASG